MDSNTGKPRDAPRSWVYDFDELRREVADLEWRRSAVGTVNPRPSGWHNDLIQFAKKSLARLFSWYARPLDEFNATVSRSLQEIERAINDVAAHALTLEWQLAQLEKRGLAVAESRGLRSYRTAYVIGLFGSGRQYIVGLILRNIGDRAKYFRDTIRAHPGPTPMIYSGHATMKYVSRAQHLPAVTSCVLESVGAGFADLIFVYRHPLDSLLSNWIWWRTYLRDNRTISGISEVYKNTDDLCAYLEQDFQNFQAFAKGDPGFFAGLPGARFLSFPEFVEETELFLQAATLTLRFEDFMVDPSTQFSKIVELLSIDCESSRLCVDPPRSKAYGYLAVKEKVPRFRDFINGLDQETKRRIEKLGYQLDA